MSETCIVDKRGKMVDPGIHLLNYLAVVITVTDEKQSQKFKYEVVVSKDLLREMIQFDEHIFQMG